MSDLNTEYTAQTLGAALSVHLSKRHPSTWGDRRVLDVEVADCKFKLTVSVISETAKNEAYAAAMAGGPSRLPNAADRDADLEARAEAADAAERERQRERADALRAEIRAVREADAQKYAAEPTDDIVTRAAAAQRAQDAANLDLERQVITQRRS